MRSKDDEIIYLASEFHLITRAQLALLTGRNPKSLNESLRRLVAQGRLYRAAQGIYKPHVYATYDIRRRQHFEHDLAIAEAHIALHRTGRLLEWQQKREKRKGEVNEDAVFYYAVPLPGRVGRIRYYFELDTGTEPAWQVDDRLARYRALRREAAEPFNVLFVCLQKERVQWLASRAQKFVDRQDPASWKLFLFTSLGELISDTQGAICAVAYVSNTYSIAPNLLS
jgi:Replication-relaxation/Transcriptional regulator, AbiEi antitoxin